MESLSIISLNCQGLGNMKKRRDVFHYLKQKRHNVYFLQDTHFEPKLESYIKAEWGYTCYFSSHNSQSRGVAILFNNNFEFKTSNVHKDEDGNFISVSITTKEVEIVLINIYGPNRDKPEFFEKIKQHANNIHDAAHITIGGDWNLVLDPNMDYFNYKHLNNPNSKEKVEEMMLNMDLVDIWRDLNPNNRRRRLSRRRSIAALPFLRSI